MTDRSDADREDQDAVAAERLAIRKRAINLLARREHARAELITKLSKHEHAIDDIEIVLDDLAAEGLQSDLRYVETAVASKAHRGIGPVRIRAELRAVGVAVDDIEAALADAEVDWESLAEAARRKRFGHAPPAGFPAKAKQMRFLQRRGFEPDQLAAAFND